MSLTRERDGDDIGWARADGRAPAPPQPTGSDYVALGLSDEPGESPPPALSPTAQRGEVELNEDAARQPLKRARFPR
jgi:hypothetical protein